MMNFKYALLLSSVAGLSTCLGIVFTYFKPKNVEKFMTISLSMAMGVMILISIKELIPVPAVFIVRSINNIISYIILLICPVLAYLIIYLSKKNIKSKNNLYRVGVLNMITLFLHNVPEGIVTFMSSMTNHVLGLKLSLAIMAHNIPEGICISVPIYYSTKNRFKAFFYTFISGIAEPLGAILTFVLFKQYITSEILNIILYFIGCLMILISLTEILPEVLRVKKKVYILYGLLMSLFILFL